MRTFFRIKTLVASGFVVSVLGACGGGDSTEPAVVSEPAATTTLGATAPPPSAEGRYIISADGTEVTDYYTNLVWQRCSEGQSWSVAASTCTGKAATHTHDVALMLAQTKYGYDWRLPNIKELASIVDRTKGGNPAIDAAAFPATPSSWFWSASPHAGYPGYFWFINFYNGYDSSDYGNRAYHVRLVRRGR